MKAVAVHPDQKKFGLVDHPEPSRLGESEVRLRILEVGICGTDKEIVAFEYGTPPEGFDYLVIGHECLAEVIETGPGVTQFKPGDLAIPSVRRPCQHDHCTACRAARQDFCFTGDFVERGIKEAHGFMTEQIAEDERFLNPVPQSLRGLGVLVEPLTIAEKAMEQVWQVQQRLPWLAGGTHNHTALVLGAGPVGLLGAMKLVAEGFKTYVYSRSTGSECRDDIVRGIGAVWLPAEEVKAQDLASHLGTIDVVYEAVGASALAFDVLHYLDANGVFVFTGVPGRKAAIQVDTDRLMRDLVLKNQVMIGTVNAGHTAFEAAIRDLDSYAQRWPKETGMIITNRIPIEDAAEPLSGRVPGIKNVICPN
ncbi:MAG: hypothetical protein FJW39_03885 [Acidobacteria bacterium]|nr:hypothetical protein [Acidobacteriota bacterium]